MRHHRVNRQISHAFTMNRELKLSRPASGRRFAKIERLEQQDGERENKLRWKRIRCYLIRSWNDKLKPANRRHRRNLSSRLAKASIAMCKVASHAIIDRGSRAAPRSTPMRRETGRYLEKERVETQREKRGRERTWRKGDRRERRVS